MIKIVLADDHPIVCQGLRALLESASYQVVGEAHDGLTAVRLVEEHKPDLLIIDIMMPGLNGLEVTRRVKERLSPRTRVIMLSMHAAEPYVLQALRYGASGYVLKDAIAEELRRAVSTVLSGRRYLSSQISEAVIDALLEKLSESSPDPYETLTTREREVLHLAAAGLTSAAIAKKLGISPRTVEIHRANLMRKLNLSSQAELIKYALQRGLIALDL